jgi:hypothetical protein
MEKALCHFLPVIKGQPQLKYSPLGPGSAGTHQLKLYEPANSNRDAANS